MNMFTNLCRNTGLMVHHIVKPMRQSNTDRQEIQRTVEEKKLDDQVTLRRTTIEEIEVKPNHEDSR